MNDENKGSDEDFFIFDTSAIDGILKYLKSVDWSEPWLIGLVTFHVLSTIVIILTRKRFNIQMFIFFILLGSCYFSEKINELAAKHWKLYSKEQYFDSNGLFISVIFSAPIILNSSLIVILWLYETYHLLIATAKLKAKHMKKTANTTPTLTTTKKDN